MLKKNITKNGCLSDTEWMLWFDMDDAAREILRGRTIDSKRVHEDSNFTILYDCKTSDFTLTYTLKGKHAN